jgi:hypothetical protein
MPSMIEAWFSASEMMASFSSNSGSNTPPLASKAAAYRMVSSVPRNLEMRLLQLLVHGLGAADEAHRRQAVAVFFGRLDGRLRHPLLARQAEVVIGAHIDQGAAILAVTSEPWREASTRSGLYRPCSRSVSRFCCRPLKNAFFAWFAHDLPCGVWLDRCCLCCTVHRHTAKVYCDNSDLFRTQIQYIEYYREP